MNKISFHVGFCFLGATALPFLVAWLYLYASRTRGLGTDSSDYWALGICLLCGLGSIAALPITRAVKVMLAFFYMPTATLVLGAFSLMYVCERFGACL